MKWETAEMFTKFVLDQNEPDTQHWKVKTTITGRSDRMAWNAPQQFPGGSVIASNGRVTWALPWEDTFNYTPNEKPWKAASFFWAGQGFCQESKQPRFERLALCAINRASLTTAGGRGQIKNADPTFVLEVARSWKTPYNAFFGARNEWKFNNPQCLQPRYATTVQIMLRVTLASTFRSAVELHRRRETRTLEDTSHVSDMIRREIDAVSLSAQHVEIPWDLFNSSSS